MRHDISLAERFRTAWRGMGSTVAVVAAEKDGRRQAMLATSVASVSLDPPSLLVCVNRNASMYATLAARGAFSLSLLAARQEPLAHHLAKHSGEARFIEGDWQVHRSGDPCIDGLPWLCGALASVFCRIEDSLDYGTHRIHVGRVLAVSGDGTCDPLLHGGGRFGQFRAVGG